VKGNAIAEGNYLNWRDLACLQANGLPHTSLGRQAQDHRQKLAVSANGASHLF
jgi:hypothetical protein